MTTETVLRKTAHDIALDLIACQEQRDALAALEVGAL